MHGYSCTLCWCCMTFLLCSWDLSDPSPAFLPSLLAGMPEGCVRAPGWDAEEDNVPRVMTVLGEMVTHHLLQARESTLSQHQAVPGDDEAQRSLTLWSNGKRALSFPAPVHTDHLPLGLQSVSIGQTAIAGVLSFPLR